MASTHIKSQARLALSRQELLNISQNILQEYAPCIVQRRVGGGMSAFSSKELLAISQEISREYTRNLTVISGSELVIMPIESGKLHVYWQFEQPKKDNSVSEFEDKSLALRIYEESTDASGYQSSNQHVDEPSELWFDIAIEANKTQQDVILPKDLPETVSLSAEIGYYTDAAHFTPLIRSKSAVMPKLVMPDKIVLPASVAQFIIPSTHTNSISSPNSTFS